MISIYSESILFETLREDEMSAICARVRSVCCVVCVVKSGGGGQNKMSSGRNEVRRRLEWPKLKLLPLFRSCEMQDRTSSAATVEDKVR